MDGLCSLTSCAHCEDYRCSTRYGIATCKHTLSCGCALLGGHKAPPTVTLQALGGGSNQWVRRGTQSHNHGVALQVELRALNNNGRPTATLVRLAQLHTHAPEGLHPTILVAHYGHRVGEHCKLNALLFGVVYLLHTGGQLGLRTTIDDVGIGSEPLGRPHSIHCHVTTAHDGYLLAPPYGGVEPLWGVGTHKVDAGEEFVGREHSVEVLALDAHKLRQTCARAYKDSIKALLVHQAVDGYGATYDDVFLKLHSEPFHLLNLPLHDALFGQAEFGDTITQHATQAVQSLKDGYLVAQLCQVGSTSQTCGATTNDGHLLAVLLNLHSLFCSVLQLPIAHKPFEFADSHRLVLDAHNARALTLALLWTHPTANGGE